LIVEILLIYSLTHLRLTRRRVKLADEVPRICRTRALAQAPHREATVLQLRDTVVCLLALIPTDPSCLVRSLVLTRVLARWGIDSCLVVGVRSEDGKIAAHAWVEHHGVPLLNSGERQFARLLEVDTSRR
jgi:hypothetical protein